ncbi:hypothetical protein H3C66_03240 [Patescibacteria group bacterium]|nr:hypothetical protein [Patescibacteria group bacterium]
MPTQAHEGSRPWFIQIYFVVATLIGLLLIVISSVTLVQLGLKEALGVKEYPSFRAPYPDLGERYPGEKTIDSTELPADQQARLEEWGRQYDAWKVEEAAYDSEDQERRRQIATSLAMLIVGVPVFGLHAPHVFKRKQS